MNFNWIDKIYKKLDNYINKDSKVYLWVSWWSDSILVFNIIKNYFDIKNLNKENIVILHYNHNFRKESLNEQKELKTFFSEYNFVTDKYVWDDFRENTLRDFRYNFFSKNINNIDNSFLILWHNLTDRIETTFMNMMRWSSINWIINMSFFWKINIWSKTINILRPLIELPKDYINSICDINNFRYFLDNTNLDISFSKRNLIRNNIISLISDNSTYDSEFGNKFFSSFLNLYQYLELWYNTSQNNLIDITKSAYWNCEFAYLYNWDILNIDWLIYLLKSFWVYNNIYRSTLIELFKFVSNSKSWFKYFNWLYIFKSHWKIYFIRAPLNFYKKNIAQQIEITKLDRYKLWDFEIDVSNNEFIWCFLRFPQESDIYKSKTLNKYFINAKVPIFWRKFVPVVAKENIIKYVLDINI